MKIQIQIIAFLMVLLMIPGKLIFAENYHIAGYVLQENDSTPVRNEIVEIHDQSGANITSFLTNDHGLYSGFFEISPASSPFVIVELSRHCGDSIFNYNEEINLLNPYLTCNFFVCNDHPCKANFAWQQMFLDSLLYQFTDVSEGDFTGWLWDFEDGTFSTEQNPSHKFEEEGTYHVKLTISGENCDHTRMKVIFAHFDDCVAQFSYQQLNQGNNLVVQFTDESLGNHDEWFWEFDDGATSNEQNPIHEYDHPGSYDVKLSIFGQSCPGNTNTHQPVLVKPGPECFALFNSYQQNDPELKVTFTDLSIGQASYWLWDFGDGNMSNLQNPVHIYENPGDFEVSFAISNPTCNDTYSRFLTIEQDTTCFADFDYQQNPVQEPVIEFTNLSVGENLVFYWDFGDGATSQETSPVHEFESFGVYNVALKIVGLGCSDSLTKQIEVSETIPCQADFSFSSQNPEALEISFINESTGAINSFAWNFGDGNFSTEENPVHTYAQSGIYIAGLTVFAEGCTDSIQKTIEITEPVFCEAGFSFSSQSPEALEISFINQSTGPINSFSWDFGDGNFSIEENPVHTYAQSGMYIVELAVFADGCSDSIQKTVEITETVFCDAGFSFSSQSPEALEISFTSQSTGAIDSFAWDFGDGSFSEQENPVHTYTQSGIYIVELAVFAVGCADSVQKSVEITEPVFCDAAFTIEQEYPQCRLASFVNQSIGNNFTSSWDFGDGTISTETNPQHEYAGPGFFTVTLSISTSDLCGDTLSRNLEVLPPLKLSGSVMAGTNTLKLGNVFLYKKEASGGLSIFDQSTLETGNFDFSGLTPGNYFVQAIPDFDFPYPVIPNYFPTYAGEKTNWPEATIFETGSLPDSVQIDLLHFDDFFDGEASISGKVVRNQGTQNFPVIIYLTDETNTLLSYKITDEQNQFDFLEIPYGNYKIYPEKAGKAGQVFSVELTEEKPGSHGIIFTETETAIVPDLTAIGELAKANILINPNPASSFVSIQLNELSQKQNQVLIYKTDMTLAATFSFAGNNYLINVSNLDNGLYILDINSDTGKVHKKLIIQH